MTIFLCILIAVLLVTSFSVGILVGIKDCKRSFGIPKGATGLDDDGYVYR